MEKNSSSNSLRDRSVGNKAIKGNKLKDSSWSSNNQGFGEDYLCGFSWPQRSYTYSFCKREFKSAQALGGHMNVHRRERAMLLRQSPPRDLGQPSFLNLNPNPKPNFPSSSSLISSPFSSTLPPLSSLSSPSSAFPNEMKKWRMKGAKSVFGVKEFNNYGCNNKFLTTKKKKKKNEIVTLDLDLEIGLVSDSEEDLDWDALNYM